MSHLKKYNDFIKTRIGFFSLLLVLLWLKNMFAYVVDFHLGIQNPMQLFILIINPLSVSMLLLSIGLFIKRSKVAYGTLFIIYALLTVTHDLYCLHSRKKYAAHKKAVKIPLHSLNSKFISFDRHLIWHAK